MAKISQEEYEVLKGLDDQWRWIARNSYGGHGGDLFVYPEKPFKNHYSREWVCGIWFHSIDNHPFQFIQWEDEEPYSVAELIEGYESEETEVKSKQELIEKWESAIESADFYGKGKEEELISYMKDFVSDLKQLDEPEVLSQDWISEHSNGPSHSRYVWVSDLKELLVPKQEEVDRAYKAGYETGKEHATRDDEPETVASVMADYFGALARLKEVLAMEVEEWKND